MNGRRIDRAIQVALLLVSLASLIVDLLALGR
jgi:hypothetical protein